MRYYEIVKEGYKEVQQKYITAGVDPQSVEKTFDTYKDLVNRNQVSGNERNIDWWGKQSFDQFKSFVDEKSSEKSTTQIKRSKIPGKSINLVDNDNWHIVIPLDKDASCFHGKNSDWCTTKPNQSNFEEYFYDNEIMLIYCKNIKTGGMWAIAAHTDTDQIEMFDKNDESISEETFNSQTGLDVDKIVVDALKHQSEISSSRDVYNDAIIRINNYITSGVGRNAQIEKDLILTKDGELCFKYMKTVNIKDNYPEDIQLAAVNNNGNAIEFIDNPSERVKFAAVTAHGYAIKYIKNPSEKVKLAAEKAKLSAVQRNGYEIEYIENPSEELQLAAVRENYNSIRHIENPSEQIQLAAVTNNGSAIQYIENPSEQIQLAAEKANFSAVTKNGTSIIYIKNPSEKVQLAAVTQNGSAAIYYIIEKGITPSEQVKLAAVTQNGEAIQYIDDQSEKVQLAAVTQNYNSIRHIKNPSEQIQLTAITQDLKAIRYIKSEKLQLAAVRENGYAIYYIDNPSEAVQLAAVTQNGDAIKNIKNPTDAVKKASGL